MKKFLTDLEIMKWDDIVKDYMIKSYDGNYSSVPGILIYKNNDKYSDHSYQLEQVPVPNIKYNLTFSVSSNRTDNFFDILKDILNSEFIFTPNLLFDLMCIKTIIELNFGGID